MSRSFAFRHVKDANDRHLVALLGLAALILALDVAACSSSSKGISSCADGKEGCHCFPNSSCFAGLTCASNLCVNLGAGGVTGGAIGSGGSPGTAGSIAAGGSSEPPTDTGGGGIGGVIDLGGSLAAAGSVAVAGSSEPPASAGNAGGGSSGGVIGTGAGSGGVGQAGAAGAAGSLSSGGAPGSAGSIGSAGSAGGATSSGGATGTGAHPAGGATGSGGATETGGHASGGSAGGVTGGAVATGGAVGCGTLIDNFETNTGYICRDNGRVGYWFSYKDAASTFWPVGTPSLPSPLDMPRGTSQRALHAYGTVVEYVGIGCFINSVPTLTYNASAYTGVRFYIMGTASAPKLYVQTRATEATVYGGTCPLATLTCSASGAAISGVLPGDWTLVSIPFSSLDGGSAPFNSSDVWSIEFQPGPGAFDFWIDDLSFY
jgi:hypothetical protein